MTYQEQWNATARLLGYRRVPTTNPLEDDGEWVILAPDGHEISWSARDFTHHLVVSHIEARYGIRWDKQPYLMKK